MLILPSLVHGRLDGDGHAALSIAESATTHMQGQHVTGHLDKSQDHQNTMIRPKPQTVAGYIITCLDLQGDV